VQLFLFLPISSPEAPSGFKIVTLHPDRSVDEVGQRSAWWSAPLHPHHRTPGGHSYGTRTFSGHPARRTIMDCLTFNQRFEDAVTEFISPVKKREMPRYIVRVDGGWIRNLSQKALNQGGLAWPAPSIYRHNPGPVRTVPCCRQQSPHQALQRLGLPRSRLGFAGFRFNIHW
jgi:hypothetical protein